MGGDVDEAVDVVLRHRARDALGARDVDVFEAEVFRGIIAAYEVVHDIGMAHAFLDAGGVPQVHLEEDDAAEVAGDFQVAFGHFFAVGDYYCVSTPRQSVHDVAAQEARCAEDGCRVASQRASAAGDADDGFAGAGDDDVLVVVGIAAALASWGGDEDGFGEVCGGGGRARGGAVEGHWFGEAGHGRSRGGESRV